MAEQQFNNDGLLEALAAFKADQAPEKQQTFEINLLNASFLVPVQIPDESLIDENGGVTVESGEEIRLMTFVDEEGKRVFPVFTDEKNFNANPEGWPADVKVLTMPFVDFMEMFDKDDSLGALALNPFIEDDGMPISRQNMAYLAQNYTKVEQNEAQVNAESATEEPENMEMEISIPADVPTPLQYELIGVADDAMGTVTKMYLLWLENKATNEGRYFLVIDGPDVEQLNEMVEKFQTGFKTVLGEDALGEVAPINRLEGIDLSEFKTFYERNL
ncbi:MAG: SseB family protein [Lactobacillaceae bacterium]|nr:SseB family protein [Lactobacillaceae bacterium]